MTTNPILITGASGFVGSAVLTELLRKNPHREIHLFLRKDPAQTSVLGCRFRDAGLSLDLIKKNTHYLDLKDEDKFLATLAELSNLSRSWTVVHLAAVINAGGDLLAQEKINFDRSLQLLEWANSNAYSFIYTSSVVAFGATPRNKERTESDYPNYHWLNQIDGYSTTKRRAHDAIESAAKVKTYLLCPGIIHGKYEQGKTSRAHLTKILEGKMAWAPGGGGSFVSLTRVSDEIVDYIHREKTDETHETHLLVDCSLAYPDYFRLYRECAGLKQMKLKVLPSSFAFIIGTLAWVFANCGIKSASLGKVVQALMFYTFKVSDKEAGYRRVRESIVESLEYHS